MTFAEMTWQVRVSARAEGASWGPGHSIAALGVPGGPWAAGPGVAPRGHSTGLPGESHLEHLSKDTDFPDHGLLGRTWQTS